MSTQLLKFNTKFIKITKMFKRFFFIIIIAIFLFLVSVSVVSARDPYPNKERMKYIVSPTGAYNANPATMLRTDGKRSDIISFSCYFGGKQNYSHYLNDIGIDTLAKATTGCNNDLEWKNYTDVKEVRKPYLKNNKNVAPGEEKYAASGYNWPIGDYMWDGTSHPGSMWATPLVYPSGQPIYRHPSCHANDTDPAKRGVCDCIHRPNGPSNTWIHMTWGSLECMAPPYTKEGSPWWENYLKPEIQRIRNNADINKLASVGIFFGIDGEGRPLKSQEGWVPDDPGLVNRFYHEYIPAVANLVKSLYPGKTIRAHTDSPDPDLLANDIDFHRESLASDQINAYIYKGATGGFPPFGHWQGFANFFYLTNSGGFAPSWPPYYQSVLGALSQHTDAITGFMELYYTGLYEEGRGTFLKFASSYIGKDINDTPGVWIYLRETMHKKEVAGNTSGKYGDYDYFLYRPENLQNNKTLPVRTDEIPYQTSQQIYNWKLPLVRYGYPTENQYVGRKNAANNRYMSFDVDDGWRYANKPGVSVDFRIVYLDDVNQTFYLEYKNQDNQWVRKPITKTGATKKWQEITFSVSDAYFNNSASEGFSNAALYPTDFRIDSGGTPVIIHLVEVQSSGTLTNPTRPKAQVSCDIMKKINNDPKEGVYSPGLNQDYIIKARLTDNNGNPIAGERIMFTYNTEWNLAASYNTDSSGLAFHTLNTTNNLNSSGFVSGDQYKSYKVSWYSIQVFYPGNDRYQPSRNDCYLPITDSILNNNTANDTRIKITKIDTSQTSVTKKAKVTYQLIHRTNGLLKTVTQDIGKAEGFYADDPNAQTVVISNADYRMAFNNMTLNGTPTIPPIPDTTPPSVPAGLTATAVSSSQINLSWTASTDNVGVTGYRIYRCQGSGCTPSTQIGTSAANSYSDTGLTASTIYVYRVAAYDAAGNLSGQSASANATTQAAPDTTPPAAPSGVMVN